MRVLVAEDDPKVRRHLVQALVAAGHAVDEACDGDEALWLLGEADYQAAVLDVGLPGRDGISVTRSMRAMGRSLPILLATARGDLRDKITGLDAGADDYLVKPFSTEELLARLRALQRRGRPDAEQILRVEDLEIDIRARTASRGGIEISLTNREFALLEVLAEASPRPVSKTTLVERVWDRHFDSGTNVLNVYVNYLRNKIDRPGSPPLLHTLRGIGFALRLERP
ncbi:MAG: response regulator transcription factor [Chthoniobacterales bacterium]|nr:response regulator transcription factor [Chthoniobacterales bacterium]